MRKVNVLFEASPMIDSQKAGVGHYVDHLIRTLASPANSEVRLGGYFFDFLRRKRKKAPVLPGVRFYKIWLSPGKLLSLFRRLGMQPPLELFLWRKSDIVFFTNYVALPLLRKRKIALAVYDLGFLDHPEYVQPVNLKYMQRFCPGSIRQADLIVTISEFTKQRLLHHFPDLRAEVVVTPIPPVPLAHTANTQPLDSVVATGIVPQKYILYVGTIEPRKNIECLVEAYALLPKEIREGYSLVLAGGKGWRDEGILAAIERERAAGHNIIQTGYITEQEKSALYDNAACFVLPSHYEGFGMPIFEAMQHSVPVAISDIAVFHEVGGDAALFFNKDDPHDIAKKITRLLEDKSLRNQLIASGKERLDLFSWETNARIISEEFLKLL